MKTGIANLPLHGGNCPAWLFPRMKKLAGEITEAIVLEHGTEEFLRRLSDPCFFQSLGCVIAFDWHSSGLTTTTTAAIKEGIEKKNLGIKVCGGKGAASRKTPRELDESGNELGLSSAKIERLKYSSRMSAKVDNNLIQDGYQLYHHSFFVSESGKWAVIQQGMNNINRYARRYHWLSDNVESFVKEPHSCISCDKKESSVLNMTSLESKEAQKAGIDMVNDNPEHLRKHMNQTIRNLKQQMILPDFTGESQILNMPIHEPILQCELSERVLNQLKAAYEIQPQSYEELVSLRGVGAKSIRALALVSELIYGCRASWQDPVKFSFAHGGKDGYPYPVDRENYDSTISFMKAAVENAKLRDKEKTKAIFKLNQLMANPTFDLKRFK